MIRLDRVPVTLLEPLGDVIPVDDLEEVVDVLAAVVLVLEVVGVFPDVTNENRRGRLRGLVLVVFGRRNNQFVAGSVVAQQPPARAFDATGGGCEFRFERLEGAEVRLDMVGELAPGFAATVGMHVLPEDGVVDVARQMEREGSFDALDVAEVLAVPHPFEGVSGGVRAVDIALMVFVVVEFHDPRIDVRFECVVVIREVW